MNIIGEQQCPSWGECEDERAFTKKDNDGKWLADPVVGQEVRADKNQSKTKLPFTASGKLVMMGKVKAVTTFGFMVVFKRVQKQVKGQYKRCVMVGSTYPEDCSLDAAHVPSNEADEEYEVPRAAIEGLQAAIWCPAKIGYVGDSIIAWNGPGAFGSQYAYSWNQKPPFTTGNPPYTEFIEVKFASAVYAVGVEIGMSRGAGAITRVAALIPGGNGFADLYLGKPLLDVAQTTSALKQYWKWSPAVCRPPFATNTLRIEMDTQTIQDWNYVDYAILIGSKELPPGMLAYPASTIIYVPEKDAYGKDSISFVASDCVGNRLRNSATSAIEVSIDQMPQMQVEVPLTDA